MRREEVLACEHGALGTQLNEYITEVQALLNSMLSLPF